MLSTTLSDTNRVPAKVLLFGEYSILYNSQGLIIPYDGFFGELKFNGANTDSHQTIVELYSYLNKNKNNILNLTELKNDLEKGLFFESNIPMGQGLGSSAAITAAIYQQYSNSKAKISDSELQDYLGEIESFFHGKSSGFDPLVCCLKQSILRNSCGKIQSIKNSDLQNNTQIFLVPTGKIRRGSKVISSFLEKMKTPEYSNLLKSKYIPLNDSCVKSYVENPQDLQEKLKELSVLQLELFKEQIDESLISQWENGIETNEYFMKLCGAGGGGYYLAFSFQQSFIAPKDWIKLQV